MQITIPTATDLAIENSAGTQYAATIHGKRWSGITERSAMWASVQRAIDDGAGVEEFPEPTLDDVKTKKIITIDTKTRKLITSGFAYNGFSFSMSEAAQRNWLMIAAYFGAGLITEQNLPTLSTIDESQGYTPESIADLVGFLTAFGMYQTDPNAPLAKGRILKSQVAEATSKEEVEAIEDNR